MSIKDVDKQEGFKEYLKFIKNWNEEHEEMKAERLAPDKLKLPERRHRIELFVTAEEARNIFALLNGEFEIEEETKT